MTEIRCEIGNKVLNLSIPENWSDLNTSQWKRVCAVLLKPSNILKQRLQVFFIVAGKKARKLFSADAEECVHLASTVAWFDSPDTMMSGTSHLPSVGIWKGPRDYLGGVGSDRYGRASLALDQFLRTGDVSMLNRMFIRLYRPFGKRIKYHQDWKAIFLLKLTVRRSTRILAMYNFLSLRNNLLSRYPVTFPAEPQNQDPTQRNFHFRGIMMDAAQNGVFGNYQAVCEVEIDDLICCFEKLNIAANEEKMRVSMK